MRLYNRYILTISIPLLLSTVIMVAAGRNSLDFFYTVYVVEALIVTELYVYFNKQARRGLTLVSAILFGGFLIAVGIHILKIMM